VAINNDSFNIENGSFILTTISSVDLMEGRSDISEQLLLNNGREFDSLEPDQSVK
jgi:hypothetical protein